jgi:hypothetical protein
MVESDACRPVIVYVGCEVPLEQLQGEFFGGGMKRKSAFEIEKEAEQSGSRPAGGDAGGSGRPFAHAC